jgi:hypothetical protein
VFFKRQFEQFATSANGRYWRTAVVPWAVLATCHVKPTLTLARGSEVKQEFRRKGNSAEDRDPVLSVCNLNLEQSPP